MGDEKDRRMGRETLMEAAAAVIAIIGADFDEGRLAGADLRKAIDQLARCQADLRALQDQAALFMANQAASLQLILEVAAGVPLSSSSTEALAAVRAAAMRVKTRAGSSAKPKR